MCARTFNHIIPITIVSFVFCNHLFIDKYGHGSLFAGAYLPLRLHFLYVTLPNNCFAAAVLLIGKQKKGKTSKTRIFTLKINGKRGDYMPFHLSIPQYFMDIMNGSREEGRNRNNTRANSNSY